MTRSGFDRRHPVIDEAPALPAGVRVGTVRTRSELEAIAPAWSALWQQVPGATPFQHPAWLVPWWRSFAHGELWTLVVHEHGRLAGVIPLYREMDGKLLPLGVGVTDWLDALVTPALTPSLDAVLSMVPELTGCETLELPCLASSSALHGMRTPQQASEERLSLEPCPCLALPDTVEALRAHLPAKQTRNLRHGQSRARRSGTVEIERATPRTAVALFDDLTRLHAARWAERGEPGVLADEAVQAFHRSAVLELAGAGLLRMYALRIAGKLAAVHYGLCDQRRAYYYLGGFEPSLRTLAPGVLIVGHAIEEAVREGAIGFDFLRGREPYKYAWGAVDQVSHGRRFTWRAADAQRQG